MIGEYSISDYYETPEPEERQPLWTPKKVLDTEPAATPDPAPAGACEFAGAHVYEGSFGRKCSCGCLFFVW